MASMEKQIIDALAARLAGLSWLKVVNFEKIRLTMADFQEHELPAVQFYDEGNVYTHEQSRVKAEWNIVVELVMKSTVSGVVDQGELFEKKDEIEQHLGGQVQLNLANTGMIHLIYLSSLTDIHSFEPFYLARMTFQAVYYKPYVSPC